MMMNRIDLNNWNNVIFFVQFMKIMFEQIYTTSCPFNKNYVWTIQKLNDIRSKKKKRKNIISREFRLPDVYVNMNCIWYACHGN